MKTLTTLIVTTLSTVLFAASSALKAEDNFHYDYATVIQSKAVYRIVEMVRQQRQCFEEKVVYPHPRKGSSNGSLIGGIIGAAVGHALGARSKHRTGATIAGAIVGASIGNEGNRHHNHAVRERLQIEKHCRMVPTRWEEEQIIGYNVVYRYNGRTFDTRLPFEPGDSLKIRVMITPILDSTEATD